MFQRLNFEAFLSTIRPSDTVAIADKRLAFLKGEIEKGVTIQEKKKILLKIEGMVDFEDVYQSGRVRVLFLAFTSIVKDSHTNSTINSYQLEASHERGRGSLR